MYQPVAELKYQIERILGWEPATHWREQDFLVLSERVDAYTNQRIDPRDLHQLWQTPTLPSSGILNALAQFADYDDWDDFLARNTGGSVDDAETQSTHLPFWEIPARWVLIIWWVSILASVLVGVLLVLRP